MNVKKEKDEETKKRHDRFIKIIESKPQKFWIHELRIQHNMLRAWRLGTFPRIEYLLRICEIAEINTNWLFWGVGPMLLKDINNKYRDEAIEKETELLNLQLDQKENEMELQQIKYENRIQDLENEISLLKSTLKNRDSVKYLYDLFDKELVASSLSDFPDTMDTLLSPVFKFLGNNSDDLLNEMLDYLKSKKGKKTVTDFINWIKTRR